MPPPLRANNKRCEGGGGRKLSNAEKDAVAREGLGYDEKVCVKLVNRYKWPGAYLLRWHDFQSSLTNIDQYGGVDC